MAGVLERIFGVPTSQVSRHGSMSDPRQEVGLFRRCATQSREEPCSAAVRLSRQDTSALQLMMAKEILCEIFGATSHEVEEMIQLRMSEC
jgi:hypothetical protein